MNLEEFLRNYPALVAIRASIATALEVRAGAQAGLESVRANEASTPEQISTATTARDAHDATIDALVLRETDVTTEATREFHMSALQNRVAPNSGAQPVPQDRSLRPGDGVIGHEARTYTQETNLRDKVSWIQDAYRSTVKNDRKATERLERHAAEVEVEQRDAYERSVTTGAFAGMIVPQYLTDMVAPVLRAGRPLANAVTGLPLPERGMSLIIPRGTTGAATAVQTTQNTAVQNTDIVNADLTIPVITVAGQQDVSRQALERGNMVDLFVYRDLARAYAANLDNQIINGTGTTQHLGLVNTGGISAATAYGAPITAALFTTKVAGQVTAVNSQGAGLFAKAVLMHPRRWGWLTSISDTTGRPIVVSNMVNNFNALANITNQGDSADTDSLNTFQYVGMLSNGLPVISDLNVPITAGTINEDLVFALDLAEIYLWEEGDGAPRELNFEQTTGGSLTTKLVVYGYSAFTAGRYPGATGKVGGLDTTVNGQIAPTF